MADRRRRDARQPIDASGELLDGTKVDGVVTLRQALLRASRGVRRHGHGEADDLRARPRPRRATTCRRFARSSATRRASDYRFSSLVLGIVSSTPFQMRIKVRRLENRPSGRSSRLRRELEELVTMFITKMSLPRRTFLRGMGATLALPLLDAMVPALTRHRPRPRRNPQRRFGAIFVPHGDRPRLLDARRRSATDFEFTPILKPLEPFRDHADDRRRDLCDPLDGHATHASAAWLSGAHPEADRRRGRARRHRRSIR